MIIHALGNASQADGDKGLGRAFAKQRRIFESIDFDEETMANMKAEFNAYDSLFFSKKHQLEVLHILFLNNQPQV